MPMMPSALQQKMEMTIFNGLKAQFGSAASKGDGYSAVAEEQWRKMAKAIAPIAMDIVMEIVQNATVLPSQSVVGVGGGVPGPVSAMTVTPGKIM